MAGVTMRTALAVVALLLAAATPALVASDAPAASRSTASLYSGPGFDTCSAPSLTSLQSWLASPYRAIGVYLGGVNRACPDGNLSASWAANAVAGGWNLLPLYVGVQAPCVAPPGLALIDPSSAAAQGTAAADDAIARAVNFGLTAGSPIYFDMEGYKTDSASCTQTVQTFLGAWSTRLRARSYLSGVYGSASSTIRDLMPLAGTPNGPDAVWIGHWNGQTSVFGDSYVPDSYWASHQRIHQYRGGHNETFARVTLNIDSNTVDAPVVGPGGVVGPVPTPPPPQAGSVTTSDGQTTVTWPANAIPGGATVAATASTLPADTGGFAAGSYVVAVTAKKADGSPLTSFAAPVTVTFRAPAAGTVPGVSSDGATWRPLALRTAGSLPATATADYTRAADGSLTVATRLAGSIGMLRDIAPPTAPAALTGRFVRGSLRLAWQAAQDNGGAIAGYQITLNGQPLATASGAQPSASVRAFYPHATSTFRVVAQDPAGNSSPPSGTIVVRPAPVPAGLPRPIPDWAYQIAAWQQSGRVGTRPAAPRVTPAWYWRWRAWRLQPFRVVG